MSGILQLYGLMLAFGVICFMLGRTYEEWRSSGYRTWLAALRDHVDQGEKILREMLKEPRP